MNVLPEGIDKIVWLYDAKSSFTIKNFYEKLYDGGNSTDFPVSAMWKCKALMKVCFFACATIKGKIPIEDVIKRRNFDGPSRCFMWLKEDETADHLRINCCCASSLGIYLSPWWA